MRKKTLGTLLAAGALLAVAAGFAGKGVGAFFSRPRASVGRW